MKEKVEEFNTYFVNVGKITFEKTRSTLHGENETAAFEPDVPHTTYFFRPQPIDVNTVILTIKELHNTNSAGSDNIQLKFIKDSVYAIASFLTYIVNTSIVTGEFPSLWKHAVVVPMFKNGDEGNVSNYRLISLLSILSKVLEKIITQQLMAHLENRNLFSNTQHGFRAKLSTETPLTVIMD